MLPTTSSYPHPNGRSPQAPNATLDLAPAPSLLFFPTYILSSSPQSLLQLFFRAISSSRTKSLPSSPTHSSPRQACVHTLRFRQIDEVAPSRDLLATFRSLVRAFRYPDAGRRRFRPPRRLRVFAMLSTTSCSTNVPKSLQCRAGLHPPPRRRTCMPKRPTCSSHTGGYSAC